MDLFIDEARYQALLSKLGQGAASLDERVALCWHQRQREPAAAQQLARDLVAQPIALSAGDRARLALVRAEQALLAIQPDAARAANLYRPAHGPHPETAGPGAGGPRARLAGLATRRSPPSLQGRPSD